jgi:hypothetical protein
MLLPAVLVACRVFLTFPSLPMAVWLSLEWLRVVAGRAQPEILVKSQLVHKKFVLEPLLDISARLPKCTLVMPLCLSDQSLRRLRVNLRFSINLRAIGEL